MTGVHHEVNRVSNNNLCLVLKWIVAGCVGLLVKCVTLDGKSKNEVTTSWQEKETAIVWPRGMSQL